MSNLTEVLDWEGLSPFHYDGMIRKKEIADGSCYFHSISDAFYGPYQSGKINKREFIRKLRSQLSTILSSKNEQGIRWYDSLSRGQLKELSETMPEVKLENMMELLDSNKFVDNKFNEFMSNIFDKDIYILDHQKKDVYMTGKDNDILYKNRESIVLIWYNQNHYDLVGIIENKKLVTLFPHNHEFITTIRKRLATF
jgi:hypothetical protein